MSFIEFELRLRPPVRRLPGRALAEQADVELCERLLEALRRWEPGNDR